MNIRRGFYLYIFQFSRPGKCPDNTGVRTIDSDNLWREQVGDVTGQGPAAPPTETPVG